MNNYILNKLRNNVQNNNYVQSSKSVLYVMLSFPLWNEATLTYVLWNSIHNSLLSKNEKYII